MLEIWGYTDRFSYTTGDTVGFRVSTTADRWDLEIGRDGAVYEPVLQVRDLPGQHHKTPIDCSVRGCGWPVAHSIDIPDTWRSGVYLMTLTGHRGNATVEEHHLFIVQAGSGSALAPYLLLCTTPTWVAYNCWGGSNAYEGITGPDRNRFSPKLSLQRPWTRGVCRLPAGAPRTLPDTPPEPGAMVRYPYMEWAFTHGYSKKYASAGWASYERHFAVWAEQAGYSLDYATLHDLETDPTLLDPYRCAILVGHDEYWSQPMRRTMDAWIAQGGRLARFAGNFFWQVRMEDEGRTQVCHKDDAVHSDPVMGTVDQHLLTGAWEQPEIAWPGAQTIGANGLRGVYAGLGKCVGRGSGGFTIYRPDHWAFAGSHLGYGDVLGASSRIFGYEVDGLDLVIHDGIPFPTGTDGASCDIEILGFGLATMAEADHSVWGETLYIGNTDAAWKARALYGEVTPETLDRSSRGNGVLVYWPRGRGDVFTAATCEWVMGLTRGDRQVDRVTRNVLDRFGQERGWTPPKPDARARSHLD